MSTWYFGNTYTYNGDTFLKMLKRNDIKLRDGDTVKDIRGHRWQLSIRDINNGKTKRVIIARPLNSETPNRQFIQYEKGQGFWHNLKNMLDI